MRVLAFDTATPATTVALAGFGSETLLARDDPAPGERPGHVSRLLPLIVAVMERAGAEWGDLERIAVGTGPGTFTGLRIGVATARGLAGAAGVPLAGVSTLHSLARGVAPAAQDFGYVLGVIDARRGEVFAAAWKLAGSESVLAASALAPDQLATQVRQLEARVLAVGDGALAFREVLERSGAFVPPDESALHLVNAAVHAEIARELLAGDPEQVHPEYIRLPDAEIARRTAK